MKGLNPIAMTKYGRNFVLLGIYFGISWNVPVIFERHFPDIETVNIISQLLADRPSLKVFSSHKTTKILWKMRQH